MFRLPFSVSYDPQARSADLCRQSISTQYYGAAPIHFAARAGHADVLRVLLDAGANKDRLDSRVRADASGGLSSPLLRVSARYPNSAPPR